jgi:hypothetical protein
MENHLVQIQSPSDVLRSIPADLPVPLADGACEHLKNMLMPDISLWSTDDQKNQSILLV